MTSRLIALMALAGAVLVAVLVLSDGDDRYLVRVEMANAGGLRNGANVRVGGAPAGRVENVRIDERDRAVADLRLEPGVAPIGAGAKAVVDTDGLFGERFVEIQRGDLRRPQPSGSRIGAQRTSVSVRLDDVVDALDVDTRQALQAFLAEQGAAIAGRGRDLAELLEALPPGLDSTGELLDQFAADNRALERLVVASDRVVGEVARERRQLGRLVDGFGTTLATLDSRRAALGETVRRAPDALASARAALTALEEAAVPLAPASRGLRSTAPALTATLKELAPFAEQAVPALRTAARVAPDLQRLGDEATPTVRELRPMADKLADYTHRGLGPFTELLDKGAADVFGVMEGWARSTQGRDASSHIFRFGASSGSDALAGYLTPEPQRRKRTKERPAPKAPALRLPDRPEVPKVRLPKVQDLPSLAGKAVEQVQELLRQEPADTAKGIVDRLKAPQKAEGQDLLDYLLRP